MNEFKPQYKIDDEIDLIEPLRKIYSKKRLIFKNSIIAVFLGIFFSLIQTNLYTSSTTFIPQLSSEVKTRGSSLSGLASLAGLNLGAVEGSSEFPPTLYPQVVESVPFRLNLLSSNIQVNDTVLTLREYYLKDKNSFDIIGFVKKYTIGLPSLILDNFRDDNYSTPDSYSIYMISEEDKQLFKKLSNVLFLSINEKEGFITMSVSDQNNKISAQIVKNAQNLLQEKIIEFKVKSSKELLEFTLEQYDEKKSNFEILQDKRAIFVDENKSISSSLFQNKLNRIESELSISKSVVQQLASQVEQAKLQVSKDTPVFTTINPVTIPIQKSSPRRSLTVVLFLFAGLIFSCGYVILKEPIIKIIKDIKS